MTEIEMERRTGNGGWKWLLLALVLVAAAIGAWFYFQQGERDYAPTPAAETRPAAEPVSEPPATFPDREPVGTEPRPDTLDPAGGGPG
ncbi:MAG: hypothetical protein GWM90_23620 [Gemmatimonadetes bacterium]|nr:hypothetical protein [Gemmatimonadota bacterium]NIQ57664.1 hypothetical protein [Gemmatimonadota bacterium]NIU77831.1 hypothetical protein [Gammaproteobacteria bacterium]NIX46959.1 hypothetical protein [Gemmatimonadota bacterium]NIY11313.1 hypothetical protein [Gemmatimonadota bacterium]